MTTSLEEGTEFKNVHKSGKAATMHLLKGSWSSGKDDDSECGWSDKWEIISYIENMHWRILSELIIMKIQIDPALLNYFSI